MATLSRRSFLTRLSLAAAFAALPRFGLAAGGLGVKCKCVSEFGIVDLHCHPALKMFLWGKRIWESSPLAHPGTNLIPMQITVDELRSGYVKGMLCAHHLVEGPLVEKSTLLHHLFPWVKGLGLKLVDKIEYQDASNFTQINASIDELETQLHRANREQNCVRFVVARDYLEFEQAINDGCIPVAHAIEGAHALGRNLRLDATGCQRPPPEFPQGGFMQGDPAKYLRNLEALKMRGVCLMTLAHFFENDVAFPSEGIAPDTKHLIGLDWYKPCDHPLTPIGEAVVSKMLDIGMIVDLTHSSPSVRYQVFDMNRKRKDSGKPMRPLTFTHTGSRAIFEDFDHRYNHDKYDDFKYYDVDEGEIKQICECNGVIGVIPENFWLVACDPKLCPDYGGEFKNGIDYIVQTIIDINSKTRSQDFDNVAIGTDFDGLADAPHDLYKPSQLEALIKRLRAHNINDDQIRKITSLNALRLLKEGWTS